MVVRGWGWGEGTLVDGLVFVFKFSISAKGGGAPRLSYLVRQKRKEEWSGRVFFKTIATKHQKWN